MAKKRIPKVDWPPKARPEFSSQKAKPEFSPRAKPDLRRSAKKTVRKTKSQPTIDPLITSRLLTAKPEDILSVTFSIRPGKREEYSAGWVNRTVAELLERVSKETGLEPKGKPVIYEHMDMVSITAQPVFLRVLLKQKEITGAQDDNPDLPNPRNEE